MQKLDGMSRGDAFDLLTLKLEQLEAFLVVSTGDTLVQYSGKVQDSYLHGCADMAADCHKLAVWLASVEALNNEPVTN